MLLQRCASCHHAASGPASAGCLCMHSSWPSVCRRSYGPSSFTLVCATSTSLDELCTAWLAMLRCRAWHSIVRHMMLDSGISRFSPPLGDVSVPTWFHSWFDYVPDGSAGLRLTLLVALTTRSSAFAGRMAVATRPSPTAAGFAAPARQLHHTVMAAQVREHPSDVNLLLTMSTLHWPLRCHCCSLSAAAWSEFAGGSSGWR